MNRTIDNRARHAGMANWVNVILGIWVAISPFVLGFTHLEAAKWNDVAVGLAVLLSAFGHGPARGTSVLNILLGAWLIASPFVLAFATAPTPLWNNIILGIVIVLAAASMASRDRVDHAATPPPTHS
jgi:SPW repeat-containing protein